MPPFAIMLIAWISTLAAIRAEQKPYNVLFIISDDLTSTALGCYGNTVCRTPNIDKLAAEGTQFSRAYSQAAYCGPSRASMMFGYYVQASGADGYTSGREKVGPDRDSWPQYFRKNGYHSARVSKVLHMGVPNDIIKGSDGADDPASWDEAFNSPGAEAKTPGDGETLQDNPEKHDRIAGGNRFVNVAADGDDLVHSDGKTAQKAVELIHRFRELDNPFFLAVGFVRPHVPFVAPRKYFEMYPWDQMVLPPKIPGDRDDIPKVHCNKRTTQSYKMDVEQQKKLISGYYASVSFMDAQLGKIMAALEESGQRGNTIVIFTSDHGYHLGEHDMWSKVSVHEESAQTPLIVSVPGRKPAVCRSLAELIDLYPTTARLCGLAIPQNIQGGDLTPLLDDPKARVKDAALCGGKGTLLRTERWAYMKYGKSDEELYDMEKDPGQYTNLVNNPEYAKVLAMMHEKLDAKLTEISNNDLGNQ
jgi:iduronate 2-sulfatase